jgi:hypothetical protein
LTSKTKPEVKITNKGMPEELDSLVNRLLSDPSEIKGLLDGILKDKGSRKFLHEKAIRKVSETRSDLLLPHMELMLNMANCENTFIQCGAIISLSNLIPKASAGAALESFKGYMELMESDSLLIAGNASANAWKIARAWPGLEPCITKKLLSIPSQTFIYEGEPSPECGNIMIGHALECFAKYFDVATDKASIIDFVEEAESNERPSVARKAKALHKSFSVCMASNGP